MTPRPPITADVKARLAQHPDFTRLTQYLNARLVPFDMLLMGDVFDQPGWLVWYRVDVAEEGAASISWITQHMVWN